MPTPVLELVRVTKSFEGAGTVLSDVSLLLPLSGITFVVGRSGSGKSVLCRLAVGLLRPDGGEVRLAGHSVNQLSERQLQPLRRRYPYLVQAPALLDWLNVAENVHLADPRQPMEKVDHAIERVGLAHAALRPVTALGPGAKKRVAIARALLLEPSFLFFDEPTTGLDPAAAERVNAVIGSLPHAGVGALVVSHDYASLTSLADRVVVIAGGKAPFSGTKAEFFASRAPEVQELTGSEHLEPSPNG